MNLSFPFNNINRSSVLPPMAVKKSVKESQKWQKAVADSLEFIALEQIRENFQYLDYFRMVRGDMSYQELKDVAPYLQQVEDLLGKDLDIPSFLKHYDVLGMIHNELVGKYIEFQDKFTIKETGEIADNEFLRFKDEEIRKALNEIVENSVNIALAKEGIDPNGQPFDDPQQQQQFLAQLEQKKEMLAPKSTKAATKSTFKTIGVQWAEATWELDKERFDILSLEKESFSQYFLTGRWFRHEKISYDSYKPENWDMMTVFHAKENNNRLPQKSEYIGRLYPSTPAEVIRDHGHNIPADIQKKLLGGNEQWKDFVGHEDLYSAPVEKGLETGFTKVARVPHKGYLEYNSYLTLQDYFNTPLGTVTSFKGGKETVADRWLPRYAGHYGPLQATTYSQLYRPDFEHRTDECIVMQGYFLARDLYGYLTYRDETTGRLVTEEVTEDILPEFLKENNIKQSYKETIVDIIKEFKEDTLQWIWKPVSYEVLKINSGNLDKPFYAYCRPCEHQIKGEHLLDVMLPVSGYIGDSPAKKILPYQIGVNVTMNQAMNMAEKEIGEFFLFDVESIPSDIPGYGDSMEALINIRDMAKDVGFVPAKPKAGGANIFGKQDLSLTNAILGKFQQAEYYKKLAFEVIGSNPVAAQQPAKYTTAEGVQVSNEAKYTQTANLYETFAVGNKAAIELHLAVAQYSQSNKKDITVSYTKSDSSRVFLQFSDPKIPLRDIGIMPTRDPKARKEFEAFRQYLMQTNTLGSDPAEVAKIFFSDTAQTLIEVATRERQARQQQDQILHERQKELLDIKDRQVQAAEERQHMRKLDILGKEIQGELGVAEIQASGRAVDKNSDTAGLKAISQAATDNLRRLEIDNKKDIASQKLAQDAEVSDKKLQLDFERLNLETQKLKTQLEMKKIDQNIAYANKN